ncbi:MAG: pyruvate kinase [Halobacteriales archaeon]|jgi:pyruvate kinase
MRNAKIVCTLGPASDSRAAIRQLAEAGMSVARLNASHGTRQERGRLLDHIRAVDGVIDAPLASMVDLAGPEIRTAPLENFVEITDGNEIRFEVGDDASPKTIGVSHPLTTVSPGDRILLDDGRIETMVERVEGEAVVAHVESGGELGGRKGVNVPGVELNLDFPTESDLREIEMAVERDADFVAASFVRGAEDVFAVGEAIERHGADIPIVAKIERGVAVENLEEIVDAAYAVMVARGDLGVERPMEEVPVIQKRIIRRCHEEGVPVITATEMLDSMIHERRPTRAEASDVANAVLDGTDAVMLSGETAVGDHPVRTVEAMDRIVREVEGSPEYAELREQRVPPADEAQTDALARSARFLARDVGASAVVAASESGYTALKTAKFRPGVPVVAATPNDDVRRQLSLSWGITPQHVPVHDDGVEALLDDAVQSALDAGAAQSGETVVVLSGMITEFEGTPPTDMLKVHVAAKTVASGRGVVSGRVTGPISRSPDGDLSDVPEGAIVTLPKGFEGEFEGDVHRLAGIVAAEPGMTGYAAMVARELEIPMVSGAPLPDVAEQAIVTIDGERGIVYEGDVRGGREINA